MLTPESFYYTTYHLARDVVGNAAPFTFYAAVAALIFEDVEHVFRQFFSNLVAAQSWIAALFLVALYLFIAFISGLLTNHIATFVRDLVLKLPGARSRVSFQGVYSRSKNAIDRFYEEFIRVPVLEHPAVDHEATTIEKVDRLCLFFKFYNPAGFQHLYREYTQVIIYRQSTIYAFCLCVAAAVNNLRMEALLLGMVSLSHLPLLHAGVRHAVDAEYQFLVSAASMLTQSSLREDLNQKARPA